MMMHNNHSVVTEFFVVGFMDHPELQSALFMLFLLLYFMALLGNTGIILLITLDTHLHNPMYFFLRNLAFVDVGCSTTVASSLLMTFVTDNKSIPLPGCAVQFFFFCVFATVEAFLLAVMAYDRFTAISNPLLYDATMSKKLCNSLVVGAYICSFVNSGLQTSLIFTLSFCSTHVVNHFFCDIPPILKLSCSDTYVTNMVHFILATVIILTTFLIIFVSYIYITTAILRIPSAQGRHKAFSTCTSHLTALTIFYGTIAFMYVRPNSTVAMDQDKIVSVFYTLVIPMLNPLIYSLRNKDVKYAFKRMIGKMSAY